MSVRAAIALAACLALGAVLGLSLLEFGILGFVTAPAALLALGLILLQSDRRTRLQRVGAFLLGGGIGGTAPLLSLVVRIGNICGGNVQAKSQPGGGASYECYSIETLWALIPYGALLCVGGFMLFVAWRQPREASA
jgi:hypothetical protein